MKKGILILSALIVMLSLTAFTVINWNTSQTSEEKNMAIIENAIEKIKQPKIFEDFIYDVGPKFNPIKKTDLDALRSFNEIITPEHAQRIVAYKWVTVVLIINDEQSNIREFGNSGSLTNAQLKFLQALDYSTNLMIGADIVQKNKETGQLEDTSWPQYYTIVPEKQAEYSQGKDALKEYLKKNSLHARTQAQVIAEKLKPAKLYFTVTKTGTIENVRLDRSTNYPIVDEAMIELIKNTPGKWLPAENIKGEKVDQELVVSFGLISC